MKIAIVGAGYVGLSLAILLSQKNEIVALDIVKEKVEMINNKKSPIKDKDIEEYIKHKPLNLHATIDVKEAFSDAEYIVICVPTNYNDEKNMFDTSIVEEVIKKIKDLELDTTIVIKSTVPVGFTERVKEEYKMDNIIFSPEFLREGKALYDQLYPSRIIIGDNGERARKFALILRECALKKDIVVKFMNNTESEAVKLFSNTYLALRVAYFNELDTYAELKGLNTKDIIDGVCLDQRIGDFYNNPSFGYGGYCLPKDTKQLLINYENVPQSLISAVVNSNKIRKDYIAEKIINQKPKIVGIYKLTMKSDSDNYRTSAILDIIRKINDNGIKCLIYEPNLYEKTFYGNEIVKDIKKFKKKASLILVNRYDSILNDVKNKIFTRDVYYRD